MLGSSAISPMNSTQILKFHKLRFILKFNYRELSDKNYKSNQKVNNNLKMAIQTYIQKIKRGELLTLQQLNTLCDTAISVFIQQPNIIQLPQGTHYIIGDIHGQFYDLLKLISQVLGGSFVNKSVVFLGDYVDRGYHSIETVTLLLAYKCLYPGQIVMLRGNHETSSLTRIYGFYDEVQKKYGNLNAWKKVVETFNYLPLVTIVNNSLMCVHGGLSPNIPFLDQVDYIERVREIPQTGNMCDLVWSDPDSHIEGWSISNRGAGYLFSKQITQQFLHMNNLQTIARAHQLVQEGYIYNFGDKSLVTVWSAPNYCYRCGNEACVMKINENNEHEFIKFSSAEMTAAQKIHYEHLMPYFL